MSTPETRWERLETVPPTEMDEEIAAQYGIDPSDIDDDMRSLDRRTAAVLVTGCIEWTGFRDMHGYGRVRRPDWIPGKGAMLFTHRASWWATHGPIPDGMLVCHKCDNPPCINPDHLFLGTPQDNVDDMVRKGRHGHYLQRQGESNFNSKLTDSDVRRIRSDEFAGLTQVQIGAMFGVSQPVISGVIHRRYWKHVPGDPA